MAWYSRRWSPDEVEEKIYHSGILFKPRFPSSFGITLANLLTIYLVSAWAKRAASIKAFRVCMIWYRQRWPPHEVEEKIYHSWILFKPRFPSSFSITLANLLTSNMVSTWTKRMASIKAFRICMTWYRQRWPNNEVEEKIYHSGILFKPGFPSSFSITLANLLTSIMVRTGTKRTASIKAFRICMTRYRQWWPPDEVEEKIYHEGLQFKPKVSLL